MLNTTGLRSAYLFDGLLNVSTLKSITRNNLLMQVVFTKLGAIRAIEAIIQTNKCITGIQLGLLCQHFDDPMAILAFLPTTLLRINSKLNRHGGSAYKITGHKH